MSKSRYIFSFVLIALLGVHSASLRAGQNSEHHSASTTSLVSADLIAVSSSEKTVPAVVAPQSIETQRRAPNTRAFADSARKESSIKTWLNDNDKLKIWLTLADDQTVDIAVFNILGKKIKDLDHSYMTEGEMKELLYSISDIPNGVYIVAAQGSNFRSAIRIVISR